MLHLRRSLTKRTEDQGGSPTGPSILAMSPTNQTRRRTRGRRLALLVCLFCTLSYILIWDDDALSTTLVGRRQLVAMHTPDDLAERRAERRSIAYSPRLRGRSKLVSLDKSGRRIVRSDELKGEMNELHASIERIRGMLNRHNVTSNAVTGDAERLLRRVKWLVHATGDGRAVDDGKLESQIENRMARQESRLKGRVDQAETDGDATMVEKRQRELGKLKRVVEGIKEQANEDAEDGIRDSVKDLASPRTLSGEEDEYTRRLYDATITFPECRDKLLEDCLEILSNEMAELQMTADIVIHEKRNADQSGYNKVVIVSDLTASLVKGRLADGQVSYPFMWDDSLSGPRMLGVDGKWDCYGKSPDDCCQLIKASVPNADTRGNHLECHFFVPYGGIGNNKRSDRILVNLSSDGRVHEPPVVS